MFIPLTPADDIHSLCDRLDWATARRVVLVVPPTADLLTNPLDMVRLRRHADGLRLEVGLITADPRLAALAQPLGIPVFATAAQAQTDERRWRRGKRRTQRAGLTPAEVGEALEEMRQQREQRREGVPRPLWWQWLGRYLLILLLALFGAAVYVGVAYAVPGATLTVRPYTETITVSLPLLADPALERPNMATAAIPARQITLTQTWEAAVATTGQIEVADAPARGRVLFTNQVGRGIAIAAGTRLSTAEGPRQVYQTLAPINLPAVLGGTAEVEVVALLAGPQGNVAADQISRVEGDLADQVEVRNPASLTGGGISVVAAVTEADVARLEAQASQYLQTAAVGQLEALLGVDEFLAPESVRVSHVLERTFSHPVGAQTGRITLQLRAEVQGTLINSHNALDLMYNALAQQVEQGYSLVPTSFRVYPGAVLGVDGQGRVRVEMIGEGRMAADLQLEPHLERVAGQPTAVGLQYLYEQLPLQSVPTARIVPDWFGRLPYWPTRMTVVVED